MDTSHQRGYHSGPVAAEHHEHDPYFIDEQDRLAHDMIKRAYEVPAFEPTFYEQTVAP